MAQGFVQLPDDPANTGKKEDHWQLATSSQYREGVVIGDSSVDAAVAKVQNAAQAASDYGLTVRPVVPDGLDVTQGVTTDAAVTGDNTGTVSAKLRGLSKIFADVWDSVNHWFKVSIQNATLAVTQSGTWTVQPGNTANTTAWKVDGSAVTQPVSGTITANIGTTGGLALDASVTGLQVAQGSTTSGQKGDLVLGAVTTNAPSYVTAQTSPLSLDTVGGLRVNLKDTPSNTNNLNVNLAASAATVTITGTVTTTPPANASTNVAQLAGTATSVNSGTKDAGTLRIVIATDQPALTNALKVDGSAVTQPVSGTFWQATQPVSGTVTANPGLATSGGYTVSSFATAASNNATALKGTAGQLYGVHVYNNASYPIYIKFYDKATTPAPATDNALLVRRIGVQAGTQRDITFPAGVPFVNGIGYAVVKGVSDTDNTSVVASDGLVDLEYK